MSILIIEVAPWAEAKKRHTLAGNSKQIGKKKREGVLWVNERERERDGERDASNRNNARKSPDFRCLCIRLSICASLRVQA